MDKRVRHAILIDPAERKVSIVELGSDDLKSAYEHIQCDMIEAAVRLANGDVVYVDEEALVKRDKPKGRFQFAGQGWFLGKGLIVNDIEVTGEGNEWTAPRSAVIDLFKSVKFQEEL
jgi:hypothetical protein